MPYSIWRDIVPIVLSEETKRSYEPTFRLAITLGTLGHKRRCLAPLFLLANASAIFYLIERDPKIFQVNVRVLTRRICSRISMHLSPGLARLRYHGARQCRSDGPEESQ